MGKENKDALITAVKIIAVLLIFILASLLLSRLFGIITYRALYERYLDILHLGAGLNLYLSKALSLVLVLPLLYGISLLFSFRKGKRRAGWVLVISFFVVFNLGMYALTRDDFFSRVPDDEPIKYYVKTPDGYRFSNAPGRDPSTGQEFQPVTPDLKRYYDLTKNGVHQVVNPAELFNPVTGEAKVWYYVTPEGDFDLFDGPGSHPRYGSALKRMTPQESVRYYAWIEAKKKKEEDARIVEENRIKKAALEEEKNKLREEARKERVNRLNVTEEPDDRLLNIVKKAEAQFFARTFKSLTGAYKGRIFFIRGNNRFTFFSHPIHIAATNKCDTCKSKNGGYVGVKEMVGKCSECHDGLAAFYRGNNCEKCHKFVSKEGHDTFVKASEGHTAGEEPGGRFGSSSLP